MRLLLLRVNPADVTTPEDTVRVGRPIAARVKGALSAVAQPSRAAELLVAARDHAYGLLEAAPELLVLVPPALLIGGATLVRRWLRRRPYESIPQGKTVSFANV